ncbi:MAG TPA: hypothetical protein VH877_15475 [Polyangia bacterium]|nr:hypothetical protein [Polyangia bacterium]
MSRFTLRDLRDRVLTLFAKSLRYYRWALVVFVIGSAAATLVSWFRPLQYKSDTTIIYREGLAFDDPAWGGSVRRLGARLKELLLARTHLERIIQEFKLYPRIVAEHGYGEAVDEMRGDITFQFREGDTFRISYEGDAPELVQKVTTRLAETLVEQSTKDRVERATVTKAFLDAEAARVAEELHAKEQRLGKFLIAHPEFAPEGWGAWSLIRSVQQGPGQGPTATEDVASLELEAARVRARISVLQSQPDEKGGDNEEAKLFERVTTELRAARQDLEQKLTHFTDEHPDIKAARARLKSAEAAYGRLPPELIERAARRGVDQRSQEMDLLQAQLATLTAKITTARAQLGPNYNAAEIEERARRIAALELEWSQLNRELEEVRARRQQMAEKQFRATVAVDSVSGDYSPQVQVLDPAPLPTKPIKSRRRLVMLGVVGSAALGVILMLVCGLLDDRLFDRVDIEKLELAPLLVVVPQWPPPGRVLTVRRPAALGRSD